MDSYTFRQIRLSKDHYVKIKTFCVTNMITLSDFYEQVLQWFFDVWMMSQTRIIFRATHRRGKLLTLRLHEKTSYTIQQVAIKYNVSNACVIYTALAEYLENK